MEKARFRPEDPSRAWGVFQTTEHFEGVKVVILSNLVKAVFPSLLFSSLPRRAIGFSYPSGKEGMFIGAALVAATGVVALMLFKIVGPAGLGLATWLTGGTAGLIIYNSTRGRVAFVKQYCWSCRLRPLIEEHEAMHLYGEHREEAVWAEARRRHNYATLNIADDPKICSFCPIAKKLRNC